MPDVRVRGPKAGRGYTPSPEKPLELSLVFMTGRRDPKLEWIIDGLRAQMRSDDRIELLVIDGCPTRAPCEPGAAFAFTIDYEAAFLQASRECLELGIRYVYERPKPNLWQGRHRVTSVDWWATANARNTAIAIARYDYIAFLDDRARLGPDWLATVRRGSRERASVLVGSYEKIEHERVADMPTEIIVKADGAGVARIDGPPLAQYRLKTTHDHRRLKHPAGLPNCGGGWLYGCTFALPLAWLLECNGLEEGCDGLTGEDYILGLMLGNNGHRIDFEPRLFVSQDRTEGTEHGFAMTDKGTAPKDKSHAALERFGKRKRTEFTPDLARLRAELAAGAPWPTPDPAGDHRDWYDQQPIRDMIAPK